MFFLQKAAKKRLSLTLIINAHIMNEESNEEPDWRKTILILHAYAKCLLKTKTWFRGNATESYLEGKEVEDYVQESIVRYLEHPEKYRKEKGVLIDYLKYNILRSLVSNDLVSKENETTKDIFGIAEQIEDGENAESYIELQLPFIEAFFDQEIDYDLIMNYIAGTIAGEKDIENIFISIYGYGMVRREIIKEFDMLDTDYDNAVRRLKTVIKKAIKKFDITEDK
jgi:hypothetical protein